MLRIDKEATERAGFADPSSYICLASFRIHPETDHPCVYLFRKDVSIRRAEVFFLANNRCAACGEYCPENGELWERGHLDHIVGGNGAQRCWCYENLQILCPECHRKKHGREPRFHVEGEQGQGI